MARPSLSAASSSLRCADCGTNFNRAYKLRRHQATTHGTALHKSHECDICEAKFDRKDRLVRHRKIHTGEDLEECEHCGRGFRRDYLRRHKRNCKRRKEAKYLQGHDSIHRASYAERASAHVSNSKEETQGKLPPSTWTQQQEQPPAGRPKQFVQYATSLSSMESLAKSARMAFRRGDHGLVQECQRMMPDTWLTEDMMEYIANHKHVQAWHLISKHDLRILRADTRNSARLLCRAVYWRNNNCVRFLLDNNFPVDAIDGRSTPLTEAVTKGDVDTVRLLLERGASVNGKTSTTLWTPLMAALGFYSPGALACVRILLEHGADVNLWSSNRFYGGPPTTPLSSVCSEHRHDQAVQAIEWLLGAGADVNLGDSAPLDQALRSQACTTVTRLLEAGADISLVSDATIVRLADSFLDPNPGYCYNIEKPAEKLELLRQAGCKRAEATLRMVKEYQETGCNPYWVRENVRKYLDAIRARIQLLDDRTDLTEP